MGLKELYEGWNFRPIMNGADNNPREQKEGNVAVDFLPNTYQAEIRNRTPGDTVVVQATADNATNGMFNPVSAFQYYTTLFNSPLKTYKSQIVHQYNAQGTAEQKFTTSNQWKNEPGVLYSTNPS